MLLIAIFLVRRVFYCVEQPIWEGFDEWAHFAFVQDVEHGRLPSRNEPISYALRTAVELAPLSSSAAGYARDSLTYDEFWRLPPSERRARERDLQSLRVSSPRAYGPYTDGRTIRQYEAQQPPLYYLLLAPIYLCVRRCSFPTQVCVMRLFSMLIAAAGILLAYKIALNLPPSRRTAMPVLLLMVSWPALLLDVSRIGNDSLALTLCSAVMLCLFRIVRGHSRLSDWILAGILLGTALLTKAYMLAFVPLLPCILLLERLRRGTAMLSTLKGMALACAIAAIIAGWWYVGTYRATGTVSGEQLDVAALRFGYAGKFDAFRSLKWGEVVDSAAASHIWAAGWSFLKVRSWMYHTFECIGAVALIGLVSLLIRLFRKGRLRWTPHDACFLLVVLAFALFCSGLAYYALDTRLVQGISTTPGWYLYAIAAMEFVLLGCCFTGLVGRRFAGAFVAGTAALASVFDLYTVHFVSVPYYTGLIAHVRSGGLAPFHPAALRTIGIKDVLARFAVDKAAALSPSVLVFIWLAYLGVTIGLLACSVAVMRRSIVRGNGVER